MAVLQVRDETIFGTWRWVDAWPSSIGLGYPSSSLRDLPSGVKKLEIKHPDGKVTYVPFASEGNEYWEKQTSNLFLPPRILTIDGKYPLKLKQYVKFNITYNLGPNINGSGDTPDACWNNLGAFACINSVSSTLQNPENYYLLLVGRCIASQMSFTVNGERFSLLTTALATQRVDGVSGYYDSVYSIIGDEDHKIQWCSAEEASSWAKDSARIYWLLVTDVTSKNQSWNMSTPNPGVGGTTEEPKEYITGSTRGIPERGGLVSYVEKSHGSFLHWETGWFYSYFYLDNGKLKPDNDGAGYPNFGAISGSKSYVINNNVEFKIVAGGPVTLTASGARKRVSSSTETYTNAAGYQQTRTVYHVDYSNQPNQTTEYITAYV